jgi:hypothetical protein
MLLILLGLYIYIFLVLLWLVIIGSRKLATYKFELLAIVRINCTIVGVIEPQRFKVVLRNGIFKGTYLT